jgi:hypothetical protein
MKIKHNIAISESGFVFDSNSGDSFSMNPIAMEIIEMMKNGKSYKEIKDFILKKYDVDAPSFEKAYYDFAAMLKHYNLIENEEEN